ncbi:MAG: ABC transporter ATP-binding protein [Firmicutes bacterium]|nr:ABC transporter ATP-binding protein [Bacillota bacterium]
MILSVDGVQFGYNGKPVLENIGFTVERGDFLAILGNNGAGKSTLIKCLNRILRLGSGTIVIEKEDISSLSRLEIAKRIGYVAQRSESGRITVFDAVLLGRKPHIKWDASRNDLAVVRKALKALGLEEFSLRYLDELSGGELQKVVLARALAQEPKVLLLDEPTSNLDLKNQLEVLKTVKDVAKTQGLAAVVVMHDLNLALRYANKFLFLKNKTVYACGGMEVMTPENIAGVYGVPVAVERLGDSPVVVPLN